MSDKSDAAQKWAEAKAALEAADAAYEAAKAAYSTAEDAEYHAWQALEALAGRVSVTLEPVIESPPPRPINEERSAFRHSLPARPIG